MIAILGIDPGKDGAMVLLGAEHRSISLIESFELQSIAKGKHWEDVHNVLTDVLRSWHAAHRIDLAVLERGSIRPGESGRSAQTIGVGWGLLLGALSALQIGVVIPTPPKWMGAMLGDLAGEGKDRAIALCLQRVPDLDLCTGPTGRRRKPHTGLADAACLALYGLRPSPTQIAK